MKLKAITTKFHAATATKPARISASELDGYRVTLPADGDFPYDDAHRAAAMELCRRMGWKDGESLIPGMVKDATVWVFAPPAAEADGSPLGTRYTLAPDDDDEDGADTTGRNLIELIADEMSSDYDNIDKQSALLTEVYAGATVDGKAVLDAACICLCGWGLNTLIAKLKQ